MLPLEHVELDPGDALFFHCNVLHKSNQNNSSRRRWAFLMAYNQTSNSPVGNHSNPQHKKLEKVFNYYYLGFVPYRCYHSMEGVIWDSALITNVRDDDDI